MRTIRATLITSLLIAFSSAFVINWTTDVEPGKLHDVVSQQEFESILNQAGGQLVVAFFCSNNNADCKKLEPHIVAFAVKYTDVAFLKVDVDKLQSLADKYGIRIFGIPEVIYFRQNTVLLQMLTNLPEAVEEEIKKFRQ